MTICRHHLVMLATSALLCGCGGGSLSRGNYESQVCAAMNDAENALASPDTAAGKAATIDKIANDLDDMAAPGDVRREHAQLVSELRLFANAFGGNAIPSSIPHLTAWEKALSEIRVKGYDVKPGWGDCAPQ